MVKVGLIWAQSVNGVIGVDGKLPWRLSEDLKHFSEVTAGSTVVMGRSTWLSLPESFRPLPGRRNVVLSRSGFVPVGGFGVGTVGEALLMADSEWVWVVGGAQVYETFMPFADCLEVTMVGLDDVEGDTFAPVIPDDFVCVSEVLGVSARDGIGFTFNRFER